MLSETDLRTALRDCYDPELPCNIVDLGMVEAVSLAVDVTAPGAGVAGVSPRYRVAVSLLPTRLEDGLNAQLAAQVSNRLAGLEQISTADVRILQEPAWSPLRITPEGRRALGLLGNRNLVQIR